MREYGDSDSRDVAEMQNNKDGGGRDAGWRKYRWMRTAGETRRDRKIETATAEMRDGRDGYSRDTGQHRWRFAEACDGVRQRRVTEK